MDSHGTSLVELLLLLFAFVGLLQAADLGLVEIETWLDRLRRRR